MKRIVMLAALSALSLSAYAAPPAPYSFYAGAHGGAAIPSGDATTRDYQTGFIAGGQLGYRFDRARIEGEFSYIRNNADAIQQVHDNIMTYMSNGFYDIPISDVLSPFIGAGIGLAQGWLSGDGELDTKTQNQFAYQVLAGLGINVTSNVMVAVQYRYLGFSGNNNVAVNGIEGGLNYTFSA